jgi:hypothetical protein
LRNKWRRLCAFASNGLPYSGGGSRRGAKTQRPLRKNAHYYGAIYSIFEFDVQEPLAYARGTATATVRERLNTQAENALIPKNHKRRAKFILPLRGNSGIGVKRPI